MMTADAARQLPWLRYALLAAVFSALWLAISLFSASSSASADDQEPGGLLGAVGSVVGGDVTEVTDSAGVTLDDVVHTVAAPVGELAQPVVEVAPEAVPSVVDTATDAANGAVSAANTALGTAANGLTGTLSDVGGGGTVDAVTAPVTGLLDGMVGSVPIVGDVLGDDTIGGVVAPVASFVDDTLGAVVDSTGELPTDGSGVVPHLPGIPLLPGDSETPATGVPGLPSGVTSPAPAVGAPSGSSGSSWLHEASGAQAVPGTITPAGDGIPPGGHLPASPAAPSGGAGSGAAGAGAAGASGTSDAAFAALGLDALASLVLHSVDDELPSSPVYDTDTTPD